MRRRVLIVDDERLLGEALCDVLSDDHDTEYAMSVAQATNRLAADPPVDVVLCDVQLPDGTAADVYAAWPGREHRIIFTTGGAGAPAITALAARTGNLILMKPFDLGSLAALIDTVATT